MKGAGRVHTGRVHTGRVHIGTSGWNYQHWKGVFYPEGLKSKDWLEFYSKRFSTVEINYSFYKLPDKESFESWRESVSGSFIFTAKANRYLTHMKKLNEPAEALGKLLDRVAALKERLGPVLFQFPPFWSRIILMKRCFCLGQIL